ncbi:hypothetical protein CQ009_04755 [Pseudomonas sp. MYb2]|nr:hypothetical protein CQ025_11660 [Pseudomonas sp. MYb3]PRC36869.1 hypothetical protein CQ009_04755 [Pseudomonas sp. MYb2]
MVYHNTDRASPLDDFCRITPANGHVFKSHSPHNPCRSEPARDSGVSVNDFLPDTPLSRAGSLLQGDWPVMWLTKDNVAPIVRRFESPIG